MWEWICKVIIGIFTRKDHIEPVIAGWTGLTTGQQGFIQALEKSITALTGSISALQHEQAEGIKLRRRLSKRLGRAVAEIKTLTKEVKECNEHRAQLEARMQSLESQK